MSVLSRLEQFVVAIARLPGLSFLDQYVRKVHNVKFDVEDYIDDQRLHLKNVADAAKAGRDVVKPPKDPSEDEKDGAEAKVATQAPPPASVYGDDDDDDD